MNDPVEDLGGALGEAIADRVDTYVAAPPVAAIQTRAAARAKRRRMARTAGSVAASVALFAGAVAGYGALSSSGPEGVIATDGSFADAPGADELSEEPQTPAVEAEDAGGANDAAGAAASDVTPASLSTGPVLVWEATDGPEASGQLFAVGDGRVARIEWTEVGATILEITNDGTTWDTIITPDGYSVSQIAVDGSTLVIAAEELLPSRFEPDSSRLGFVATNTAVFLSSDGGQTWSDLAYELPARASVNEYFISQTFVTSLAVSNDTVVVASDGWSDLDVDRMIEDSGLTEQLVDAGYSYGVSFRDDGFTIEFEAGQVVEIDYEDFGVSAAEAEQFRTGGESIGVVSTKVGDAPWAQVADTVGANPLLAAVGDGFLVTGYGAVGNPISMSSPDGLVWDALGVVEEGPSFFYNAIATRGDSAYAFRTDSSGFALVESASGAAWTPVASFVGIAPTDGLSAGDAGFVIGASPDSLGSNPFQVVVEAKGYRVEWGDPVGGLTLSLIETGEVVLQFTNEDFLGNEPPPGMVADEDLESGLSFVDVETGEVYVEFSGAELDAAFAAAMPETEFAGRPETWIGWSSTGEMWGWQTINDAFGVDAADEHWVQYAVGDDYVIAVVDSFRSGEFAAESGADTTVTSTVPLDELGRQWFVAHTGDD